jgi:hypothetical protein
MDGELVDFHAFTLRSCTRTKGAAGSGHLSWRVATRRPVPRPSPRPSRRCTRPADPGESAGDAPVCPARYPGGAPVTGLRQSRRHAAPRGAASRKYNGLPSPLASRSRWK